MEKKISANQFEFITTNKYYRLDWVAEITFADASRLCEVISPYSDGRANYYYRIRTKKEIWLPRLLRVVIEVAEKYGVDKTPYENELTVFLNKEKRKAERIAKQREEEERKRHEEYIERIKKLGLVVNTQTGNREPFRTCYLDGAIERRAGFDMVYVSNNTTADAFFRYDEEYRRCTRKFDDDMKTPYCNIPVWVEDLQELAYLVYYMVFNRFGYNQFIGLVVSEDDYKNGNFKDAYDRHIEGCPFF